MKGAIAAMDINFQDILFLLGPSSGELIWNILLYILFVLAIIMLFAMPDKNLLPTLLVATVLLSIVVSKLNISISPTSAAIFPPRDFIQFTLNAVIFIFPLLVAGMVRAKKKGQIVAPAILSGLLGGVYFFGFWFFIQRS